MRAMSPHFLICRIGGKEDSAQEGQENRGDEQKEQTVYGCVQIAFGGDQDEMPAKAAQPLNQTDTADRSHGNVPALLRVLPPDRIKLSTEGGTEFGGRDGKCLGKGRGTEEDAAAFGGYQGDGFGLAVPVLKEVFERCGVDVENENPAGAVRVCGREDAAVDGEDFPAGSIRPDHRPGFCPGPGVRV